MISINPDSDRPISPSGGAADRAPADPWSVRRLLEWTTAYFSEKGFAQPRLDAEVLLAEALGCQRIFLYTQFDLVPEEATRTRFRDWVQRHGRGEPVAYLVGHREFFSLKFVVSPDVLIPRPETEHAVSAAIDWLKTRPGPSAVADIGTGSGIIAVTIARHVPQAAVVATDLSAPALEIARSNAELHEVTDRIRFVQTDLLADVAEPGQFDLIVSNPPYIGTGEQGTVAPSVANYEPHDALFAGPAGDEVIARLIDVAGARLVEGGELIFEMSPLIAERCRERVANDDRYKAIRIVKDLAGHRRILMATRN